MLSISSVVSNIFNVLRTVTMKIAGAMPRTAVQVQPFGIESSPLPGMKAVYLNTKTNDNAVILGYYLSGINNGYSSSINPGETLIYSTDSSGAGQGYAYWKNDGTVRIGNNNGYIQITPGELDLSWGSGQVNLNSTLFQVNLDSGGQVKLLAGTNHAVQFEALNNNLQDMVTQINTNFATIETTLAALTGGPYTLPTVPLDLHAAEETNILIP